MIRIGVTDCFRQLKPYLRRSLAPTSVDSSKLHGFLLQSPIQRSFSAVSIGSRQPIIRCSLHSHNDRCRCLVPAREYRGKPEGSQWGGPYNNFGHRTVRMSYFKIFYHLFVMGTLAACFVDWKR
jgi:hypothetical protein